MVSGELNGGRIHLEHKEMACSAEVFLLGAASSRLVKVSIPVIAKWVVLADGRRGSMKSTHCG